MITPYRKTTDDVSLDIPVPPAKVRSWRIGSDGKPGMSKMGTGAEIFRVDMGRSKYIDDDS